MKKFEPIFTEEERKKLTRKNKAKIRKCLENVDPELIKLHEKTIEDAASYATCLEEINRQIERDGYVDEYQNGENQWGVKKSVAAELKPKYSQIYQGLIKQLKELLPSEGEKDATAEIMEFLNSGR